MEVISRNVWEPVVKEVNNMMVEYYVRNQTAEQDFNRLEPSSQVRTHQNSGRPGSQCDERPASFGDLLHSPQCGMDCDSALRAEGLYLRHAPPIYNIRIVRIPKEEQAQGSDKPLLQVLKRTMLMSNQHNTACWFLKPLVQERATSLDPGAIVQLMCLIPRPPFQLAFEHNSFLRPPLHSVLLITVGGREYVLDPSGEQYGISARDLFLPFREYKKRYMLPLKHWGGKARWTVETFECEQFYNGLVSAARRAKKARVEVIFQSCLEDMRKLDEALGGPGGNSLGVVVRPRTVQV
ncbi:hypothetical protein CC86DRAFT_408261 [Ophiobolus disseminans]|uniref:Uncharacterized protein n=1 Tax=Ophiobolus disseminans TaxID=1469910 RepID=A0A6A6ZTL8_9PLEO|nr:hypothetical protein CC86DRAFT_408261 [Ophiobolus disseminans]